MSAPSVSVVIATRDRPELLRQAVEAVLAQDYAGSVEVVIVFDQSEVDDTLTQETADRRVRVMANRRTPGLAGSRNTGVEVAEGRYVAFCDDDDLWAPSKLRRQVELLEASGRRFATCGIRIEYEGGTHERTLEQDEVVFEDLLRDRIPSMHPSTFLLDRVWANDELGPVSEDLPFGFGEDYDFVLRAARLAPVANLSDALVTVRWTGGSYFFRRWEAMEAGLTWLLDTYPQFDRDPRGAARLHGQVAFAVAAQRRRRDAARWIRSTLSRNPREPRAYLAAVVALGVVGPPTVMGMLHKHGRGI
jgi:glycosyltransferase involved in cell wall biosynthesis